MISEVERLEGCVARLVVLGWGCLGHIPDKKKKLVTVLCWVEAFD